jgi:hypothetical protein
MCPADHVNRSEIVTSSSHSLVLNDYSGTSMDLPGQGQLTEFWSPYSLRTGAAVTPAVDVTCVDTHSDLVDRGLFVVHKQLTSPEPITLLASKDYHYATDLTASSATATGIVNGVLKNAEQLQQVEDCRAAEIEHLDLLCNLHAETYNVSGGGEGYWSNVIHPLETVTVSTSEHSSSVVTINLSSVVAGCLDDPTGVGPFDDVDSAVYSASSNPSNQTHSNNMDYTSAVNCSEEARLGIGVDSVDSISFTQNVGQQPEDVTRNCRQRKMAKKDFRKANRVKGLEYTSANGVKRVAKGLQPNPCKGIKCFHKCGSLWSEEDREHVFRQYWGMGHQQQRDWLLSHIDKAMILRRTTGKTDNSIRHTSFKYRLPLRGNNTRVCKRFFF